MAKTLLRKAIDSGEIRLVDYLSPSQRAAQSDPCRKKAYITSRRAGKTTTSIIDMLDDGWYNPDYQYAYIALTKESVEQICFPILAELNKKFTLDLNILTTKLKCVMPSGATISFFGADRPGWMKKLLGTKLRKVAIDEAAAFKVNLVDLVYEILEPATDDLDGQIILTSTPGILPRGLFWDLTKHWGHEDSFSGLTPPATKELPRGPEWSVHRWSTRDNPGMVHKYEAAVKKILEVIGDPRKDPKFMRNYLGAWVFEFGERVYGYNEEVNVYEGEWQKQVGDHYILGIDFGWDDYTAFSLNCWREDSRDFVEVESIREKNILLADVNAFVKAFQEQYGDDILMVADAGHKQLFEEFRRRFELNIIAAEKTQKNDWIGLWNTEAKAGNIKIVNPEKSPHVEEMTSLVWKIKADGWKVEMPGARNDCCDAHLQAFRHAHHYRFEQTSPAPERGTAEFDREMEQQMMNQIMEDNGYDTDFGF
jgi:hypothetical protein